MEEKKDWKSQVLGYNTDLLTTIIHLPPDFLLTVNVFVV